LENKLFCRGRGIIVGVEKKFFKNMGSHSLIISKYSGPTKYV
jgi:hypothetical protein